MDISGSNQSATWSLQVFRNSEVTPLYESEQIFSTTSGGSGTQNLLVQLLYRNCCASGDVIRITNNTNANITDITSAAGSEMYGVHRISVPTNGTPVSVILSVSKIGPVTTARDAGYSELIIGSSVLSSFTYNAGNILSGTLTSNISNSDSVTLTIIEG
jgi:hypothetical protein